MDIKMRAYQPTFSGARMGVTVRIAILAFLLRGVYADFCTRSYSCQGTCSTRTSYYTACGLFLWGRCIRHKNVYKVCPSTCYKRECCTGYEGTSCDIPICFGSQLCPNGGTCKSPNICDCPRGFSSPNCTDINECDSSSHGCHHNCVNTNGSYHCACRAGFTLNSDLKSCLDLNECNVNNGGCSQICNNNVGSFSCSCREGYWLNTDGRSCDDINECSLGISGCSQQCINTEGSFTCSCNTGYTLGVNGGTCEDVDECVSGDTKCEGYCNNIPGSYTCYCGSGYIPGSNGYLCEDVNECETGNGGCDHICINEAGSYRCECRDGFRAVYLSPVIHFCKDIDECMESGAQCSQICDNTEGSYMCSCNAGYKIASNGVSCEDINDCEGVMCMNEGTCIDGINRYVCTCVTGYSGQHCESDINECIFENGGCQDLCTNTMGSFNCSCFENRELQDNGVSCVGGDKENENVFGRLKIAGQQLPKPCFILSLFQYIDGNDVTIYLSSTSMWYKLIADENIMFTNGIVFVNVNNFSVPLSIRGIEVDLQQNNLTIKHVVKYKLTQGTQMKAENNSNYCGNYNLSESDIFDFLSSDSFMKTFMFYLSPAIPKWIRFEKLSPELLSLQDTKSNLVYGRDMDNILWCDGAPVIADHIYTVFRFSTAFQLNVLGDNIFIPKPFHSRSFCLIIDIFQHNGGTVFLMVPEGSREILQDITMFKALMNKHDLYILPRGIGISLFKGVSANYHKMSGQLWNGDTMFTPSQPDMNFWVGGGLIKQNSLFIIKGNADIFFGVPSIQTMLTSLFVKEWTGLIDIQLSVSPVLKLRLFGKEYSVDIPIITSTVNAYISLGGTDREWCGDGSNPEGLFLSVMVELNPFKGVPFLQDFVFSSKNRVHVFMNTDLQHNPSKEMNIISVHEFLELYNIVNMTTNLLKETSFNDKLGLTDKLKSIVEEIAESLSLITAIIDRNCKSLLTGQFKALIKDIERINQNFTHVRSLVYVFLDKTEFIINEAKHTFTTFLKNQVNAMEVRISNITTKITDAIINSVGQYTGFGLKFTSDWSFLGLKFFGFDFELVYSEGNLLQCSRFKEVKKLLSGENAVRILVRLSRDYKFGNFLKYEKGMGFGVAISTTSFNVLLQLQAHIQMLGMKVTGDLFISLKGIYFYVEGNIWNIFLAQIDVTAEVGKDWDELTFNLRGRFVAKARKRRFAISETTLFQLNHSKLKRIGRQIQTDSSSFQDSYLDGLKKVIRLMSDEAQKRLTQVQNALTLAQRGLTKAQDWLEKKQDDVRAANEAFDTMLQKLETTKEKLEIAKGPLSEAMQTLRKAQININNLCTIRPCKRICIPGIKCQICSRKTWFGRIHYPCCRFTSCMLSFPDPICVLANLACRIIRAAAYLLLEAAKIFVRVAMIAFDVAQAAVSVAQFAVDKSRVVLVVSEGILELAKVGLEIARGILEAAKIALETVKTVIGAATMVLEYVLEYGLKSIIDVKNCGFDIALSTKDLPVFEISCEVNAFRLGWTEIKLKINFKNILQSIWQAARATIGAIVNVFNGIFSTRQRRDMEFNATSKIHVFIRKIRESDYDNDTIYNLNKTIDIGKNISGFRESDDSDFGNRVEIFKEKCTTITLIQDFMQDSFNTLQSVINESISHINEIENVKMQIERLSSFNISSENMTGDSVGINTDFAAIDYNMTENDIDRVLNDTKTAAAEDPLLNEIQSAASISSKSVDDEMESVETIDYRSAWFSSMKNMTQNYFNESECDDFQDCIFYSISNLYVLYESEDFPNIARIQESILGLESLLIDTFQNETFSMKDTSSAFEYVLFYINSLVDMNLFCSEPPTFVEVQLNKTVVYGSDVKLFCNATGVPQPHITWLKNDAVILGEQSNEMTVLRVTETDTFDKYNCIAGNIIANISSSDGYINVFHNCSNVKDSFSCLCNEGYELHKNKRSCADVNECLVGNGGCDQRCINTKGSFECTCEDGYFLHENKRTCVEIEECLSGNDGCSPDCSNKNGSLACSCNEGYELHEQMKICIDIDECLNSNGGCDQVCNNTNGSFICLCTDGYKLHENKLNCMDIDECMSDNGDCQHKCNNTKGSFICSCNDGYKLHGNKRTCIDIDECFYDNGGCDHKCQNLNGSFTCSCNDGYALSENNIACIDIDECQSENGGCFHKCINTEGSFSCLCNEGYELDDNSRTCIFTDLCFFENGGCEQICDSTTDIISCSCKDGYTLHTNRKSCKDINECEDRNGGCSQTCKNLDGSFKCTCSDGYQLDLDLFSCFDINECTENNGGCKYACINFDGTYSCVCPWKRILKEDGLTCQDVDDAAVVSTIRLSIEGETAIRNFSFYTEIRKTLENYFRKASRTNVLVFINSIRAGSIIVDYTVVIDEVENTTTIADTIVMAILDLEEEGKTVIIDGKYVPVKPILPTSNDPCHLREQLVGQCEENTHCQVDGNKPSCRITTKESVKGNNFYIGLILGVVSFFLLILLIVFALKIRKRKLKNTRIENQESGECDDLPYQRRTNVNWNTERKAYRRGSVQSMNKK